MKFNIVYADPPWSYRNTLQGEFVHFNMNDHYNPLSTKDLCELDVKSICEKDCFLFLWATFPCLQEALEVIKSWGFKYKTVAFTWIKIDEKTGNLKRHGIGFYTRPNPEIMIVAKRGKIKIINRKIDQVQLLPREHHSKKPDIIRDYIVQMCGDLPRIELFARQKVDGWEALGDEIDGLDIRESLKIIKEK